MPRPTLTPAPTPGDAIHAPYISSSIDATARWTVSPGSTRRSRPTIAWADMQRAAAWYEEHAPPGSVRLNLAPVAPGRLTARYPLVSLGDPRSLLKRPAFTGHRPGPGDLPRLERLVAAQRADRTFLVLTRGQEDYGGLNGLLPKRGSIASLTRALRGAAGFRLVYRRPTARIYEYGPRLAP